MNQYKFDQLLELEYKFSICLSSRWFKASLLWF